MPRINALGQKPGKAQGRIIGIDLQEIDPIPGAEIHVLDFLEDGADEKIKAWLDGPADVVMSDMAAASSGHKQTDHLRIVALGEAAADLAFDVLAPGGTFVAKVLAGGAEGSLQTRLKQRFEKVINVKPPASRFGQFREIRGCDGVSRVAPGFPFILAKNSRAERIQLRLGASRPRDGASPGDGKAGANPDFTLSLVFAP